MSVSRHHKRATAAIQPGTDAGVLPRHPLRAARRTAAGNEPAPDGDPARIRPPHRPAGRAGAGHRQGRRGRHHRAGALHPDGHPRSARRAGHHPRRLPARAAGQGRVRARCELHDDAGRRSRRSRSALCVPAGRARGAQAARVGGFFLLSLAGIAAVRS